MESHEVSVELTPQELEDPNATEFVEFDDLDTVTLPIAEPSNTSDVLEIEYEDAVEVEIELEPTSVDRLLTRK